MEYKSPLQDDYKEPSSYGSLHSDRIVVGRRYTPYTSRRVIQPGGPSHSSQGPNSSRHVTSMQHRYTDQYRPAKYPKELTNMFGAKECKLCAIELLSPIVAKMHYSGKPHLKKVKLYLRDWSSKTGLPMPDVKVNDPVDESIFPEYCEVCNVHTKQLNEQLLHYSGKIHRKNMLDPANAKKKKKTYDVVDLSGRFGIGKDFSTEVSETEKGKITDLVDLKRSFTCELCNVTAVSHMQLEQHLSGKKHKEKLEKQNYFTEKKVLDNRWNCTDCNVSLETRSLYMLHINGKRHEKTVMKKGMNGQDYCKTCDVSFTSPQHYQDHMAGKKHEKQCHLKRLGNSTNDQKCTITCQSCPFVGNLENHVCDKSLTKIDFENLEKKWVCTVCHNMVFESETEFNEHKNSSRHILCVLNKEEGDPINEETNHTYCILCKKQYDDYKEYTDHLFGEKHMRLSQEQTDLTSNTQLFQCIVCNLTLTEQLKDQHLQGRDHYRELWKKEIKHILIDLANKDLVSMTYRCDHCNVGPVTFKEYCQHVVGEDHVNVMIDSKMSSMKHS